MTYLPAFTTDGGRGALSNNIIGGQPGHPYFHLLVENLVPYNWNLFLPYVIISWTSGQWFVTAMWEKYHSLLKPDTSVKGYESLGHGWHPLHHVLMDMREGADEWVFFTQVPGGTWSNWDSDFFPWLGDHLLLVFSYIVLTLGVVIGSCVCLSRWWARRRTRSKGYKEVASMEQGDSSANR
jgi:inositol phosphorylceramide mannosyltransferase catalytic subunit